MNYKQFRTIMSLVIKSGVFSMKLEDFISGKALQLSIGEMLQAILDSEVDEKIIKILTGKEAEDLSPEEAIGELHNFFVYIKSKLIPALKLAKNS